MSTISNEEVGDIIGENVTEYINFKSMATKVFMIPCDYRPISHVEIDFAILRKSLNPG